MRRTLHITAACALLLGGGEAGATNAKECEDAFLRSPAGSVCSVLQAAPPGRGDRRCYYKVSCQRPNQGPATVHQLATPADAAKLHSCDGRLYRRPCVQRKYDETECRSEFSRSPAARTCIISQAETLARRSTQRCKIEAKCGRGLERHTAKRDAAFRDLRRLRSCRGALTLSCRALSPERECAHAFGRSQAAATCEVQSAFSTSGPGEPPRCRFQTLCLRTDGSRRAWGMDAPLNHLPRLVNCDGVLKTGCSTQHLVRP